LDDRFENLSFATGIGGVQKAGTSREHLVVIGFAFRFTKTIKLTINE